MTTPATPDASKIKASRLKLVVVALLFIAPVLASYATFYVFRPSGGGASHGQLLTSPKPLFHSARQAARQGKASPTKPIPALVSADLSARDGTPIKPQALFLHQWVLLYIADRRCAEQCRTRLYDTRQVRTATDRDRTRIRRVLLMVDAHDPQHVEALVQDRHPDLRVAFARSEAAAPLLHWFALRKTQASAGDVAASGRVYLIDPHGNWFMYYSPGADPKGMLKDLKRVMKASFIG